MAFLPALADRLRYANLGIGFSVGSGFKRGNGFNPGKAGIGVSRLEFGVSGLSVTGEVSRFAFRLSGLSDDLEVSNFAFAVSGLSEVAEAPDTAADEWEVSSCAL